MKYNYIQRKWQNKLEVISFKYDSSVYDGAPFRPKNDFICSIATSNIPIETLAIKIPDTIVLINRTIYLLWCDEKTGILHKITDDVNNAKLLLMRLEDKKSKKEEWKEDHILNIRKVYQLDSCIKFVENWRTFKEKVNDELPNRSILQEFVFSGKNKVNVSRYVYFNPLSLKSPRENYGFVMVNRMTYDEKNATLNQRYSICEEFANSFEVIVLKGVVMKEYEAFAKSIVNFIERTYGVRISKLVLDFIRNYKSQVLYLIDVKAFEIDHQVKSTIMLEEEERRIIKAHFEHMRKKFKGCAVCLQKFGREEAKKRVTMSMLYEIHRHLVKRGIRLLEHLEVMF